MQTTAQNTMSATTQNLATIRNGLPFEVEQAWTSSESYIRNYLSEHAPAHLKAAEEGKPKEVIEALNDRSFEVPALLAAGRLDWLLQQTRSSLSGLLSTQEVAMLLDCYQSDLFSPDQFGHIASDLCSHLGGESHLFSGKPLAQLIEKLIDLTSSQRLTLADALEQAWHRGIKQENKSPKEFFATLGIELT
jgi:hypothetical protein